MRHTMRFMIVATVGLSVVLADPMTVTILFMIVATAGLSVFLANRYALVDLTTDALSVGEITGMKHIHVHCATGITLSCIVTVFTCLELVPMLTDYIPPTRWGTGWEAAVLALTPPQGPIVAIVIAALAEAMVWRGLKRVQRHEDERHRAHAIRT